MIKTSAAILAFTVLIAASCTLTGTGHVKDYQSENYILKKRVNLIERKNTILESENLEQRNKIKTLDDAADKLGREYSQYRDASVEKIKLLNKKREILKNKLETHISLLQKDMEERGKAHALEIEKLGKSNILQLEKIKHEARDNEKKLGVEIIALKNSLAEKEKKLGEEITALKNIILEKEKLVFDKEKSIDENKILIDVLKKEIVAKSADIKKLNETLEEMETTIKGLRDTVIEKNNIIDELKLLEKNRESAK